MDSRIWIQMKQASSLHSSSIPLRTTPLRHSSVKQTESLAETNQLRPLSDLASASIYRLSTDTITSDMRESRFNYNFTRVPVYSDSEKHISDRRKPNTNSTRHSLDILSPDSDDPDPASAYIDQTGAAAPVVPDAGSMAPPISAAVTTAVPTNLKQILTGWVPGPSQYGFQLKFQCSSSSGSIADLQAQAPSLIWREFVTYSRNDFSHRIAPPNPTILPPSPSGISFAASKTTVVNPNLLEFNDARDTHWMPTSAVRADDYSLALATPRPLPAIMESSQLYQFSRDGSTWTNFAGPFTLRRSLFRGADGNLHFTTDKVSMHSVTEDYKP